MMNLCKKWARLSSIAVVASCLMVASRAHAAEKIKYDSWESMQKLPVPDWFNNDKFGIFIHWGAYSKIGYIKGKRGYAEHIPKLMYKGRKHYYPYLEKRFGGRPPEFGYKDIIPLFKAEKWDPDAWADLFKKSGAKYVILTAEHHDGFALWDSDLTDWCATKIGPKRDLVGDLGVAVRKKGLRYGPSYHRERHPGFFAKKPYNVKSEPMPDIAKEIKMVPEAASLYGPFEYTDAFIADYVARWKELERKYHPDFMWIDDIPVFYLSKDDPDSPQLAKYKEACRGMIADYLNASQEWGKEVYLNNKGRETNWPKGVGCLEKDNLKLKEIGPKWQNPATLGTSYGYMKAEEEEDLYKSPTELVHLLVDVVSKNGNLLLNIGPKADGTIPEGMQTRLLAMGEWLKLNGEAIYGTRYASSEYQNVPDMRFTQKGDALYAILLKQPAAPLSITLAKGSNVSSVSFLGSDEKIKWTQSGETLKVIPPSKVSGQYAWPVKIQRQKK